MPAVNFNRRRDVHVSRQRRHRQFRMWPPSRSTWPRSTTRPSFIKGPNQTVAEDAGALTREPRGRRLSATARPTKAARRSASSSPAIPTPASSRPDPAVSPTGVLTYTPATNAFGSATITLKITDNGGIANGGVDESATQTFVITVTPVNDAPVCQNTSLTTAEDTVGSTAPVCSDVDGDTLTYSIVGQGTNGTAAVVAGQLQYTPNPNFHGTDSFTYRANDGTVNSNTASVAVTVTPVNDAPVCQNTSLTTAEDTVGSTAPGLLRRRRRHADLRDRRPGHQRHGRGRGRPAAVHPAGGYRHPGQRRAGLPDHLAYYGPRTPCPRRRVLRRRRHSLNYTLAGLGTNGTRGPERQLCLLPEPELPRHRLVHLSGQRRDRQQQHGHRGHDRHPGQRRAGLPARPRSPRPRTPSAATAPGCSDVDGDTLTYAIVGQAANGTAGGQLAGQLSYTPNAELQRHRLVHLQGQRRHRRQQRRHRGRHRHPGQRRAGRRRRQLAHHGRGHASAITAPAVLSDVDGDTLTYGRSSTRPTNGTAGGSCADQLHATPRTPTSTAPTRSPTGPTTAPLDSNTATVTITVTPVNDAPVAVDDTRLDRRGHDPRSSPPRACSATTPTSRATA